MEKLLALFLLARRFYSRWLFRRLLSSLIMVFALIIVIAILVSAFIVAAGYVAFIGLCQLGVSVPIALLIVFLSIALIIVLLVAIASRMMRISLQMPNGLSDSPTFADRAVSMADAFSKGLSQN